ncbi:transposable element Tc1 transposase [Trichonephila clavipes]|uniref:Transposable element Tc1 transposase n=1 Tax=Trichonephila clavipes TaxID=2585209 RepID=A0A8X6RAX7_TRICX|nr:transposable element Tc1 transposase [Trichonephila clavipes]
MAWTSISIGGHTDLHIIRKGSLKTQRYATETLRPHVATTIGDTFLLMQANARNPTARLVENFLEVETIQLIEWSACSPGLNLDQYVWGSFGRRIQRNRSLRVLYRTWRCTQ